MVKIANEALSLKRANSVADARAEGARPTQYLVTRGLGKNTRSPATTRRPGAPKPPGNGGHQHAVSLRSRWTSSSSLPLPRAAQVVNGNEQQQAGSQRHGQSRANASPSTELRAGQASDSHACSSERAGSEPPEADGGSTITGTPPDGNAQRAAKSHQQQLIRQTKEDPHMEIDAPAVSFAISGKSANACDPPPASWRHRSPPRPPASASDGRSHSPSGAVV